MIREDQIPDEVMEAAVGAALEAEPHMRDQLHAALAAALAAWPGMIRIIEGEPEREHEEIVLPLPKEPLT